MSSIKSASALTTTSSATLRRHARQLALALAVAGNLGSAFAAVGYEVPAEGFVSSKSRAEVRAELAQARSDGSLNFSEHSYPVIQASAAPRSREQIRAELIEQKMLQAGNPTENLYFG